MGTSVVLKQLDLNFKEDISTIKKKIDTTYNSGFKTSLSLKPVFNSRQNYVQEFYKIIDTITERDKTEPNIFKRSKVSVKLRQLGKNQEEQDKNFMALLDRAKKNNVFVWISAVFSKDVDYEFNTYKRARKAGFDNIGLTICTYHKNCHERVDAILAMNGHVRLVKGFYSGDIKDWSLVTQNYLENARKLCASNNYHFLASHDFKVLNALNNEFGQLNNIEIGFFYHAKNYALQQMEKYTLDFPLKSLYVYYGDSINYVLHNALHVDSKRIFKRRILSKFIESERIKL